MNKLKSASAPYPNKRGLVIAVAGNPNTGKSTLINACAGSRLHIGNWPGVTVEKKSASFIFRGQPVTLVDLPGAYSLSPYTQEEVITRDFLISQTPDAIINVVDATNLERNLYFTIQLLELEIPLVMALNMQDEATSKGFCIDTEKISTKLSCDVAPTVATTGEGMEKLLALAVAAGNEPSGKKPPRLVYGEDIEKAVADIIEGIKRDTKITPSRWLALKLLEADQLVGEESGISPDASFLKKAKTYIPEEHRNDLEEYLADTRYALAAELVQEALKKPEKRKIELTERIDSVVLNRYFGVPVFLLTMWLIFKLTFDISGPFTDWFDSVTTNFLQKWAAASMRMTPAPDWMVSLVTEGIVAGVGFVLAFAPPIFAMMFFITMLEASGYMARAAFVMDRLMQTIGLHGKSFIPLLLGFGCNVPAVYATRTLENTRDKALTALLIPLMSCGARLPVYVLFAGAFYAAHAGTIIWSLYVLGIVVAIGTGFIFKKTIFGGASPVFILELPPYRMPPMKTLVIHTWEKGKHFLGKAGTYILAVSVLVWFALNLPWGVESRKDSWLGKTGEVISPVFAPLGFGTWEASASLLAGIIAKEVVISTMAEIYNPRQQAENKEEIINLTSDIKNISVSLADATVQSVKNIFSTFGVAALGTKEEDFAEGLRSQIALSFTPLSAYAFMVFVLLYMPCVVVLIALRQEFGTWKWAGLAVAYQTLLAWMAAFIVYQGGKALGI